MRLDRGVKRSVVLGVQLLVLLFVAANARALPIAMTPDPVNFTVLAQSGQVTLDAGDTTTNILTYSVDNAGPTSPIGWDWLYDGSISVLALTVTPQLGTVNNLSSAFSGNGAAVDFDCASASCGLEVEVTLDATPTGSSIAFTAFSPPVTDLEPVSYTVIPEPSTALLLGWGLIGLARRTGRWA